MPLDDLVRRILSDARQYADKLVQEAQLHKLELLEKADVEAEQSFEEIIEAARRSAEEEKHQRITAAALEARKAILEEKRRLIHRVLDLAVKAIVSKPPVQYVEVLLQVLLASIPEYRMELILSSGDRDRVGDELVARANEELERSGRAARVVLSDETRSIAGGLILRSESVEINCSIEVQVEAQRDEIEDALIKMLFPAGAPSGRQPGGI
jgi:V/A-type H+-transporting ATPase subunit E